MLLTHSLILERLSSQPQERLQTAFQHMTAEPIYASIGALGVNLFDFIPSTPAGIPGQDLGDRRLDAYAAIWRELFTILSDPDAQDDPNRNILAVLRRVRSLVTDISEIAEAEALFELAGIRDRLEGFEADREVIENFLPRLSSRELYREIFDLIAVASRPYMAVDVGDTIPEPEIWALRDHVSYFRTGQFAERLLQRGRDRFEADGDRRFLAFAHGFRTAYCTKAVGSPFINSIVGSVPRLHWWRSRWIERFVDSWSWGFYDPAKPEPLDDGTEDFENWRSLCNANLHSRIAIGVLSETDPIEVMQSTVLNRPLPDAVPQDFRDFVVDVFREVYGDAGALGLVTPQRINDAVVWAWLTLWFSTGSDSLGCNPQPPLSIEDGTAFFDPATVDPFETPSVNPGDEDIPNPLDVEPEPDPNLRKTVCGAILAYLGLVASIFYPTVGAIAAIVGGILLIIDGTANIDWKVLRRDLYVVRWYLYNAIDGMNRMLVFSGLGHPYAHELDDAELRLEVPNLEKPPCGFPAGPTLYTGRRTDIFPASLWDTADPDKSWICPVPPAPEIPTSIGFAGNGTPDLFIDRLSDPDIAGLVLDHRSFPLPPVWPDPSSQNVFASAVDNAIDVILREDEASLPDLNLQGDRGIGFSAWTFDGITLTDPVAIQPTS